MLARFRPPLTYANVMATIAVFVALGGSSYAALSVSGKNVKNSSLTGKDVKNSSLTTSDVKNRSLLSRDFKAGQLPTGATGATGPAGPTGPAGTAKAYATIDDGGTVVASKSKNITQANIDPDTVPGAVCLTGLNFVPKTAIVANQPLFDGGEDDVIVGAFLADSFASTGDCQGKVLVRTFDISSAALANRAFTIWLQD